MRLLFLSMLAAVLNFSAYAQSEKTETDGTEKKVSGISVSPSSLRFNTRPGSIQTQEVKVSNNTDEDFKFQIGFSDFMMNEFGKPGPVTPENSKYALSKWVAASPSFVELKAGESKKIIVTVNIPDREDAHISAWTILTIDQISERPPLTFGGSNNAIAMGIVPSFGFGVYVYQNPPNVKNNQVEITSFRHVPSEKKNTLILKMKNTGDGIGFCGTYVELTHLKTGKQKRLPVRQFTILPGFIREIGFDLPEDMPDGAYSAAGVLDFNSTEEIQAAEIEFTLSKK
ncbi:MAG TPA: hypothetical protein PKM16_10180 [Bacteroidia bacterium]|nr:hypothetical protein [Bacteroidia bacterium]